MHGVWSALLVVILLAGPVSGADPAKRTLDKNFWLLTAATASLTVVDVEATQYYLHRDPWRRELNPIYGPHPSRARMYATVAGENLAAAYLAYRFKKSERRWLRKLWWLPQTVTIAGHAGGIVFTVTR